MKLEFVLCLATPKFNSVKYCLAISKYWQAHLLTGRIGTYHSKPSLTMHALFTTLWQTLPPKTLTWQTPWLLATGSLTQRLQQVCQQEFKVQVLKHEFIAAPEFICEDLNVRPKDQVLQREVLLCDGEEPLVFACSLLPEAALQGRYQALKELGSRPLGHWIFSEPVLKRQTMLFTELPSRATLFQNLNTPSAISPSMSLWGRKTLFVGAAKPLLVSEFFLPALKRRSGDQHGA